MTKLWQNCFLIWHCHIEIESFQANIPVQTKNMFKTVFKDKIFNAIKDLIHEAFLLNFNTGNFLEIPFKLLNFKSVTISGIEFNPTATINYLLLANVLMRRHSGTNFHFWMHIVFKYTTGHAPPTFLEDMVPWYKRRFNDPCSFFRRKWLSQPIQLGTI